MRIALVALAAIAPRLAAQTGQLVGSVRRDTLGHELAAAEVSIPSVNRTTTANFLGDFRIDGLAPGKYVVQVRHVGYSPLRDTIDIVAGQTTAREYIMAVSTQKLDTVRTLAAEKKWLSPALNGYEERKAQGFGRFIDDSVMRKNDDETLITVILPRMPGLRAIPVKSAAYLVSTRTQAADGPVFQGGSKCPTPFCKRMGVPAACYVTIFIDGIKIYDAKMLADGVLPPDMNELAVNQFAAAEFYPGGATLPVQYSETSGCGALLLWTREK